MRYLLDYLPKLADWLGRRDLPKSHADSVLHALFKDRVDDFLKMSQLPNDLQQLLTRSFRVYATQIVDHQVQSDENESLLLQLGDGGTVKCWLRRDKSRRTAIVSCHALGEQSSKKSSSLGRELSSGEILEQALRLLQLLTAGERITHFEISGSGEPLANLDPVLQALEFVCSPTGMAICPKLITVKTSGRPAAIRRLARLGCEYRLVIELPAACSEPTTHANSETQIFDSETIMTATDFFSETCHGRLVFEYSLTQNVKDPESDANALADLVGDRDIALVLISSRLPGNVTWSTCSHEDDRLFVETLTRRSIDFRVRASREVLFQEGARVFDPAHF